MWYIVRLYSSRGRNPGKSEEWDSSRTIYHIYCDFTANRTLPRSLQFHNSQHNIVLKFASTCIYTLKENENMIQPKHVYLQ